MVGGVAGGVACGAAGAVVCAPTDATNPNINPHPNDALTTTRMHDLSCFQLRLKLQGLFGFYSLYPLNFCDNPGCELVAPSRTLHHPGRAFAAQRCASAHWPSLHLCQRHVFAHKHSPLKLHSSHHPGNILTTPSVPPIPFICPRELFRFQRLSIPSAGIPFLNLYLSSSTSRSTPVQPSTPTASAAKATTRSPSPSCSTSVGINPTCFLTSARASTIGSQPPSSPRTTSPPTLSTAASFAPTAMSLPIPRCCSKASMPRSTRQPSMAPRRTAHVET